MSLTIIFLSLSHVSGQTLITGSVLDKEGEPIDDCIVIVKNQTCLLSTVSTEKDGFFKLQINISSDSLCLEFMHMLYELKTVDLPVSDEDELYIGEILLQEKLFPIEEAVVSSNFIQRKGTDLIVNMRNNPNAKNRNVLQFLNTLPGVNGLNINGKGVSKIVVNNRELKLDPIELYKYLNALKAEDVQSLKIMPNGGVRYDANHKGGVIFIYMRKGGEGLLSGSMTLPVTIYTDKFAVSTNTPVTLNYTNKKLSSYTYLNADYLSSERMDLKYILHNSEESNSQERSLFALSCDQSLVYDINKKHSVGVAINYLFKPYEYTNTISAANCIKDNTAVNRGNGTLNYNWYVDEKGSNISFTGDYLFRIDSFVNSYQGENSIFDYNESQTDKRSYSGKIDCEYIFNDEVATLNFGLFCLGMNANQEYAQNNKPDKFRYGEDIYGAYIDYYTPLFEDKFDVNLGLRYENADVEMSMSNIDVEGAGINKFLNDIYPSMTLVYNFPNRNNCISLTYDRVVNRPIMACYDPVIQRNSEHVYSTGAKYLNPQYENSLSLIQGLGNHKLGLFYIWKKDIYDIMYLQQDNDIVISEANVGSSNQFSFYMDLRFWIIRNWLQSRLMSIMDYISYNHSYYGKTDSLEADLIGELLLDLPQDWRLAVSGNYMTPKVTMTEKISANWGLDFYLKKVINESFILSFRARNILYNKSIVTQARVDNIKYNCIKYPYFRTITFSLTYNFGVKSQKQVKTLRGDSDIRLRSGNK